MEIRAEMDSVQFYKENSANQLGAGIYKITEHDGSISYCELNGFGGDNWMDEAEWEMKQEELNKELFWQSNMDAMDRHYDELEGDVDQGDANDCGGCSACHMCMS